MNIRNRVAAYNHCFTETQSIPGSPNLGCNLDTVPMVVAGNTIEDYFSKLGKRVFIKGNLIGLLLFVINVVFFLDFSYLLSSNGPIVLFCLIGLTGLLVIYLLTLIYVFPVSVEYDLKVFQTLKYSFILSITQPLSTCFFIAVGICLVIFIRFFPVFLPLAVPFFSFLVMWYFVRILNKSAYLVGLPVSDN
jgi:uncharacterized membrane protein YesL